MARGFSGAFGAIAVTAIVLTGCSSCAKTGGEIATNHDKSTRDDGGAEAGARAPYAGPFEAHAVARALSWKARLVPMADGTTVLDAGLFVYALAPDGTITRSGDDASYIAQMPPDDVTIGGYDVTPLPYRTPIKGTRDGIDLRGAPEERAPLLTWDPSSEIDLPDLPAGIERAGDLRRAADGTTIVIMRVASSESPTTIVAAPHSRAGKFAPIIDLGLEHKERARCEHVPSWGRPHLLCRSWTDAIPSVHRLDGDHWTRVNLHDDTAEALVSMAVAEDGTLWLGMKNGSLVRKSTTGALDTITFTKAEGAIARASYTAGEEFGTPAPSKGANKRTPFEDQLGARRFERIGINTDPEPLAIDRITRIVPRSDGEAWVLTGEMHGASMLFHITRPAIAPVPPALFIGSETDQRNELRNTRAPVPWVGHCTTLFVPLAKQRADGSLGAEAVWSREAQIGAMVKKVFGPQVAATPDAMLVEGKLSGRRVVGVLVVRTTPNTSEELVEKAANAISDDARERLGNPPDITCSAPVLERASHL